MSWQSAIDRTVQGLGYDLVDAERTAGGLLRVTIDRLPGRSYPTGPGESVLVEDCEIVTRQLQYLLEVEAVDYARLEVSSPGLDRPLRKPADWERFIGSDVEIALRQPFNGRRKWTGRLLARDGGAYSLALPQDPPQRKTRSAKSAAGTAAGETVEQTLDFTLDEVRDARLVPVIDFKGRRGLPTEAPTQDGGQNR
ncbi:ribosome maturation factor RimP [Ideonella sp. A 288]|uniref:ribosome maturation factor RimP n=1 Tax=Ideonella sp. A 288 TaxID=1962181 RepID=UPI000B4B9AC2|nr:ribosome maturation factor RimP [Ideonella sp. A 288]